MRYMIDKRTTLSLQVADELVNDFVAQSNEGEVTGEHKNIRRRVYDALNVLMAMKVRTRIPTYLTCSSDHYERKERD